MITTVNDAGRWPGAQYLTEEQHARELMAVLHALLNRIYFAAAQTIKGYVLTSRIIGTRLRLRPMAVFLWLLIGGNPFGSPGLVFISLSC